jgi:hypothetical protein|tara:strand:+ start:3839 stop:4285 length:447 start_codon:yes stop_codon:yes gene_type:complete
MNPIQLAWNSILKGVSLPDDAIGPFEDPDHPDKLIYHSPGHIYHVDKDVGVAPDNPEDSQHEFGVAPWWDEGHSGVGYHLGANESPPVLTDGKHPETWKEIAALGGPEDEQRRQAMLRALGMEDGPPTQESQPLRGQTTLDHWLEREQ